MEEWRVGLALVHLGKLGGAQRSVDGFDWKEPTIFWIKWSSSRSIVVFWLIAPILDLRSSLNTESWLRSEVESRGNWGTTLGLWLPGLGPLVGLEATTFWVVLVYTSAIGRRVPAWPWNFSPFFSSWIQASSRWKTSSSPERDISSTVNQTRFGGAHSVKMG